MDGEAGSGEGVGGEESLLRVDVEGLDLEQGEGEGGDAFEERPASARALPGTCPPLCPPREGIRSLSDTYMYICLIHSQYTYIYMYIGIVIVLHSLPFPRPPLEERPALARALSGASLPPKSHDARPVHLIITMIKWIWTDRLSINKSLFHTHARQRNLIPERARMLPFFAEWVRPHKGEHPTKPSKCGTYETVTAIYKTVKAIYKTVKARYETFTAR